MPFPWQAAHPELEAELVRQFVSMLKLSILQSFIAIPLFGLLMLGHAPAWRILCWVGIFLLMQLLFARLVYRFHCHAHSQDQVFRHYQVLRELMLFSALVWSMMMWFMFPQMEGPYRIVVVLWLAGGFAAVCLLQAPCRDLHLTFFVGYWAYPLYRFHSEGTLLYSALLVGAVIFILVQWEFLSSFNPLLRDTVRLRERNAVVLRRLQELYAESAAKRELLEQRRQMLEQAAEQMRLLADSDVLTGCLNQRALRCRMAELDQSDAAVWSLAMLDLDEFKQVNDRFGHLAGDQVLQQAAQHIASCLEGWMTLARYGGEEFVVLAPGLAPERLAERMEAVRLRLAQAQLDGLPDGYAQTVSIGVAGQPPLNGSQQALLQADAALYRAKASGRNRVCVWDAEPERD
ncbi:GGDEF domain-containing protein [Chromobacterium alkanivorans]|uniref:GGDEF domain-containing protein n=1 Tax=Chromobacterium alkanivorans TaxID=1071719 RepID=UPI0019678F60|nr:GGDEF domain-containing protein [Chromobacterium alkanivorans]MBN3004392.1 GGDEF domain-containing protein [Chromobacterium alkanivorans]